MDKADFHGCHENTYRSSLPPDAEICFVPVRQGHAVVHHQNVWHGSGPNLSPHKDRRALVGHYLRGDVQFLDEGGGKFFLRLVFTLFYSTALTLISCPRVRTESCTLGVDILHLREIQAIQLCGGG